MTMKNFKPTEYEIEMGEGIAAEYEKYEYNRRCPKETFEHWQNRLPCVVFKYRDIGTIKSLIRVIDIFKKERLYFPKASSLNDPFEGGNVDFLSDEDKERFRQRIGNTRILSLSKDCFSAPLWAHYASMGNGICIGFHTYENFSTIKKVEYSDTIDKKQFWTVDINDAVKNEYCWKNKDWSYENEYRILKEVSGDENEDFFCFSSEEILTVIFGENVEPEVKKILLKVIPENCTIFDIKVDKNRARYYLIQDDLPKNKIYKLDELYDAIIKE
ncbi:DUF2971 domain-containing protein [Anaerotruncus sp. 80]|uniref:DUF2971 domain-containing protein n=2 Tax=Oscillospiraceae TaxID=216572 RepID=A0A845QPM1_9FIRM|nr:DUF2971 domain-containing protein [Anaerotruncus colihominis]NCF03665.1 DUF2971 domain-containing protein [Anaerotruncus sp. 80]